MKKLKRFDAADFLETEEQIAEYLAVTLEENPGDTALLLSVLSDIARARNMTKLAEDAGLSRKGLYKALDPEASPKFETVASVMQALGLQLTVKPSELRPH